MHAVHFLFQLFLFNLTSLFPLFSSSLLFWLLPNSGLNNTNLLSYMKTNCGLNNTNLLSYMKKIRKLINLYVHQNIWDREDE